MNTQAAAELHSKVAAFLAAGRQVQIIPGFERATPRAARIEPPPTPPKPSRRNAGVKRPRPKREGTIEDHIERLRTLAKTMSSEQVAAALGYSLSTIKRAAQVHDIRFEGGRWRPLSDEDIAKARELSTTHNVYQVAALLDRSRSSLRALAKREGFTFKDGTADSAAALRKFNRTFSAKALAKEA